MKASRWIMILIGLLALIAIAAAAWDLDGAGINWSVLSGGGASSSAGNVSLVGSIGQTANGNSSGRQVSMEAGFLAGLSGGGQVIYYIYQPVIRRSP